MALSHCQRQDLLLPPLLLLMSVFVYIPFAGAAEWSRNVPSLIDFKHQQFSPTGSVFGSNLKWMTSQGGVPTFGNWSAAGDTPYTQKFENLRRSKKTATGVYSNPNEVITETPDQPPPPLRSPLHPSSHDALNQRQRYRSAGMQTPDRKASSSDGRVPVTPGRSRLKQGGRGFEPALDEVTVPPFGDWDDANAASGEKYTGIFNRVRRDKLTPNSSVKQQPPSSPSGGRRQEHKVQQACSCCIL
uniref:RIN4 pathogenic type III effector avirulence factor Avr cleavage site domain-containing protein n=1 Tax=Oryza barthii TaxID=65489 RepID=A0A0D3F5G7_9ORYZ